MELPTGVLTYRMVSDNTHFFDKHNAYQNTEICQIIKRNLSIMLRIFENIEYKSCSY